MKFIKKLLCRLHTFNEQRVLFLMNYTKSGWHYKEFILFEECTKCTRMRTYLITSTEDIHYNIIEHTKIEVGFLYFYHNAYKLQLLADLPGAFVKADNIYKTYEESSLLCSTY